MNKYISTGRIIEYLIVYIYWAACFQVIAKKTKTPNPWLAWIPVAQIYVMVMVAKKPMSWFWYIVSPAALLIFTLLAYIVFRNFASIRLVLAGLYLIGTIGTIVTTILIIIVLVGIVKALKKPGWMAVLFFVPLVNFFFWAYLAFSENNPDSLNTPHSDPSRHRKLFG